MSEKLHKVKLNHPAQIQLDTRVGELFFYISPMYEFSHSQGHSRRFRDVRDMSGLPPNC